jgi:hypothetical protein
MLYVDFTNLSILTVLVVAIIILTLIQNPKLALLALALPLALLSRWRSLPLGGSVQNPKSYSTLLLQY